MSTFLPFSVFKGRLTQKEVGRPQKAAKIMLKHLVFFKASIFTCWLAGIVISTQPQVSPCAGQVCYSHVATEDAAVSEGGDLLVTTVGLSSWGAGLDWSLRAHLHSCKATVCGWDVGSGPLDKPISTPRGSATLPAPVQARGPPCGHLR